MSLIIKPVNKLEAFREIKDTYLQDLNEDYEQLKKDMEKSRLYARNQARKGIVIWSIIAFIFLVLGIGFALSTKILFSIFTFFLSITCIGIIVSIIIEDKPFTPIEESFPVCEDYLNHIQKLTDIQTVEDTLTCLSEVIKEADYYSEEHTLLSFYKSDLESFKDYEDISEKLILDYTVCRNEINITYALENGKVVKGFTASCEIEYNLHNTDDVLEYSESQWILTRPYYKEKEKTYE